jgi:hypothetical protein
MVISSTSHATMMINAPPNYGIHQKESYPRKWLQICGYGNINVHFLSRRDVHKMQSQQSFAKNF